MDNLQLANITKGTLSIAITYRLVKNLSTKYAGAYYFLIWYIVDYWSKAAWITTSDFVEPSFINCLPSEILCDQYVRLLIGPVE